MANRLKKLAQARYTPGTPYQPFVPAYCIQAPYTVPGYYTQIPYIIVDDEGQVHILGITQGGFVPPQTKYREVCFDAVPEQQAVPPAVTYSAVFGWDGGGRSIAQLDDDGYFEFQVNDGVSAAVVGLSTSDASTLPNDATHALYIHGAVVEVLENGTSVHTASVTHDYDNVYRITRSGLTVTYSTTGWSYTSLQQASGARLLDAAIYASGDFVDNPLMVVGGNGGSASGTLEGMQGYGYEGATYAEAYGTLGSMTGEGSAEFVVSGSGTLGALIGVGSEGEYIYGGGELFALSGSGNGGFPEFELLYAVGVLPAMAGVGISLTGEVGTVAASLPAMGGIGSEGAYAEIFGTLPAFQGYGDSGWPVPGETYSMDALLVGDFYIPADVQSASMNETLEFTDAIELTIQVDDAIFDALMLTDSVSVTQAIEAAISMTLLLGNSTSNLIPSDALRGIGRLIGDEPAQLAVNVLTSALTNYSGFNFTAFANAGQELYGARADGVYRARMGDDDGEAISAFIDFGSSDFGSSRQKTMESIYLGVATDGELYARVDTGLDSRLYRVVQRGDMMRALTAKGVGSRIWNVALEIVDATEFELDLMEIQVGVASRRWSSR